MKRKKYTQQQLHDAFTKVQDKQHWKNPIDALVEKKDIDIVTEAIIHFTGSIPTFQPKKGSGKYRVQAAGYFLTIGA